MSYEIKVLNFQKVTFEREIEKIMQSLHEARARLVVRFVAGEESCRSEVVSINTESGVLGVSPFVDKSGKQVMPPAENLTIATVVGGMECLFETSMAYKNSTHAAHEISFPKLLRYQQKRSAYRVDTRQIDIVIECSLEGDILMQGKVVDLSATGTRFIPEKKALFDQVSEGQRITRCSIGLPNIGPVNFVALVRFKGETGRGEALLGLEVEEIENSDQAKLERYIRLRDLELRRDASDV